MKKKKLRSGIYILFFVLTLTWLSAFGADASDQRIYDFAGLFSESEKAQLEEEISKAIEATGLDLAVVTTNYNSSSTSMEYADEFYEQYGFGTDENHSGALLLLDMDHREIWISTEGNAIQTMTDARIDDTLDVIYDEMVEAKYAKAAEQFISQVVSYAGQEETLAEKALLGLVSGLFISALVCFYIVLRYKQARTKKKNYAYRQNARVHFVRREDIFLRQTVTQRRIPKDPPPQSHSGGRSGGSPGGGSTTHVSSSGRTHGGGGRKF